MYRIREKVKLVVMFRYLPFLSIVTKTLISLDRNVKAQIYKSIWDREIQGYKIDIKKIRFEEVTRVLMWADLIFSIFLVFMNTYKYFLIFKNYGNKHTYEWDILHPIVNYYYHNKKIFPIVHIEGHLKLCFIYL